jgi:hypothetical protein
VGYLLRFYFDLRGRYLALDPFLFWKNFCPAGGVDAEGGEILSAESLDPSPVGSEDVVSSAGVFGLKLSDFFGGVFGFDAGTGTVPVFWRDTGVGAGSGS